MKGDVDVIMIRLKQKFNKALTLFTCKVIMFIFCFCNPLPVTCGRINFLGKLKILIGITFHIKGCSSSTA